MEKLPVVICTCNHEESNIRIGFTLLSLIMQPSSSNFSGFSVYVHDSGPIPITADRWTTLIIDLLIRQGHSFNYTRNVSGRGVALDRCSSIQMVPKAFDMLLQLDDDFIPMPGSINLLVEAATSLSSWGFVQGTKIELDPHKIYQNDINELNQTSDETGFFPIFFGDGAFILFNRNELESINWNLVTKHSRPHLTGEDTKISALISQIRFHVTVSRRP